MDDVDNLRDRILEAALPHVPFDGWTLTAMRRGAVDAGYTPADAERVFAFGTADMVAHYCRLADRRMVEELERRNVSTLKIRDRVATGVRVRLEQATPHREAKRRAVAILSMPQNAPLATRALYNTVDAIWRAAGDTSTDWNFYSKRALLAGVYGSTMLFWLNDRSENLEDTWAFLDRRIDDVMRIPRITARLRSIGDSIQTPMRVFCRRRSY